jgi:uncharacterized membrane protein
MPSEKFRHQLRQEAQHWETDGLISPTQFQQLAERYQFDRLDTIAKNRFTLILIGMGCILIGLGVITFVAANWQEIPREIRVALLISLFIGVNFAGFALWRDRSRDQWQQRLGQGLLLLGGIILGANMALMAQMFHMGGSPYGLYLTWGIGVLAMSYSLRLTSLGMLAVLLIGIGYWQGLWEVTRNPEFSLLSFLVQQMPLMAGVLYLPLAYWCRSRVLFALTAIAVTSSLTSSFTTSAINSGLLLSLTFVLPAALLWGYDDSLWNDLARRSSPLARPFQSLARSLAILYLGGLFYVFSFQGAWSYSRYDLTTLPEWRSLFSVIVLVVIAIVEWVYLVRFSRSRRLNLNTLMVGSFILMTAVTHFWAVEISPIPIVATFLFNVLLAVLAIGTIRESLSQSQRVAFWFGIILLALQILSRLLEYETGLLVKALVFILCGVGVIAAGLWFERYVRRLNPPVAN